MEFIHVFLEESGNVKISAMSPSFWIFVYAMVMMAGLSYVVYVAFQAIHSGDERKARKKAKKKARKEKKRLKMQAGLG